MDLSKATSKSIWKERSGDVYHFYCPLCRAARRVGQKPKPQPRHFVQIGITAAFFTLLTWQWFSWKGIVSYLPLWVTFEVLYRSRVRAVLVCDHCGFDPFLYLVDVKKSRQEVEKHWKAKFAEKGIPYPGASEEPSNDPEIPA